jgi:branched-subunit amino acid ABC-type transport system permease component
VGRPPGSPGRSAARHHGAALQPVHPPARPGHRAGFWFILQRTRAGRFIRAAALDRETLGALGVNVSALYTGVFVVASFLGGLGGALITPMRAGVPGMDTDVIVDAFVVVVIGGLGSFWGTFLAR